MDKETPIRVSIPRWWLKRNEPAELVAARKLWSVAIDMAQLDRFPPQGQANIRQEWDELIQAGDISEGFMRQVYAECLEDVRNNLIGSDDLMDHFNKTVEVLQQAGLLRDDVEGDKS